ncbi:uncharacterized protein LOC131816330 isoform X2 [Mustela lutreola]|uniref:uncharacterized protein LOC131816330 isoform X2 n=1 Tax=Mustela lutreola TaxID=9666 RepID=UPI0027977561|nr:uncharacterized protein LOC131816330 isoform X2 [Mustela lutreola]
MGTFEGPSGSTLRTAWPLLPLRCGMMAQDFWKLQKLLFLNGGPKVSCDLVSRAACAPNPGVLFFLFVLPLRLAPPPPATVGEAVVGQPWKVIPLSGTASDPSLHAPVPAPPEKGGRPANPATAPPGCRSEDGGGRRVPAEGAASGWKWSWMAGGAVAIAGRGPPHWPGLFPALGRGPGWELG